MENMFANRHARLSSKKSDPYNPTSAENGNSPPSSISGLPRQFVNSMRTLFNILDDAGVGLVPLAEIERRWRDDAVPNLPGVLDSLRAVAPTDGLLSFETFVWGLRSALARARQCRERTRLVEANNLRNKMDAAAASAGSDDGGDGYGVLPPYYYQRPPSAAGVRNKPLMPAKGFFRTRSGAETDVEGLRSESHAPFTANRWTAEPGTGDFPKDPLPGETNGVYHLYNYQERSESRPFKPGHRRSNSGPISTATVLPSPKRNPWPAGAGMAKGGEVRVAKMGYATKFAADPSRDKENRFNDVIDKKPEARGDDDIIKSDLSGDVISLKSEPTPDKALSVDASGKAPKGDDVGAPGEEQGGEGEEECSQLSEKSELDCVTATTLFISTNKSSFGKMKPIGLSGKYIGITGTMQRAKSAAAIPSHYGSLRRPAMTSRSKVTSASETCFNDMGAYSSSQKGSGLRSRHKSNTSPNLIQQYFDSEEKQEEQENEDPFYRNQTTRSSSSERKRAACPVSDRSSAERDDHAASDGQGRRCNSASPPERPALKSARNSSSPDPRHMPVRPKSAGPESEASLYNQLLDPPPPARSSANATVFPSTHNAASGGAGCYATVGRRRGTTNKRRDPRRHTVANGIDYNVLKCMKLLEQEKDLVLQGLDSLERGRDWFQRRLRDIQERQRLATTATRAYSESDAEVSQARLDELLTRISEMTRLVGEMTDAKKAKESRPVLEKAVESPQVVSALREQNHVLTQEVSRQTEKISQLEHEKSVLVQQLFQAKAEAQTVDGQVNTSIFI